MAMRAMRARTAGDALTNDPDNPSAVLARGHAYNPGINRRNGDYLYRTVVRGEGPDGDFEMIVDVYARDRLTGREIMDRAARAFRRGEGAYRNYPVQVAALGPAPEINVWILFASRNTGAPPP
jgi:hypothetical protein